MSAVAIASTGKAAEAKCRHAFGKAARESIPQGYNTVAEAEAKHVLKFIYAAHCPSPLSLPLGSMHGTHTQLVACVGLCTTHTRTAAEGVVVLNGVHQAACSVSNWDCAIPHGIQLVETTRLKPAAMND